MTFTNTKIAVNYWQEEKDQMPRLQYEAARVKARKMIVYILKNTAYISGNFELSTKHKEISVEVAVHWRVIKHKKLHDK